MEVRDFTSGQKVALEASARPQTNHKEPKSTGKETSAITPAPKGDKVDISTKGGGIVVEKSGAIEKVQANQQKEHTPDVVEADSAERAKNVPLRRDYAVENGDLVVKFVDTQAGKIVKEIPAEETRRIKEAISRFRENEPANHQPATAQEKGNGDRPKEIDVTS